MSTLQIAAAMLSVGVGLAHSAFGERYILVRLFRRTDLPKLFAGTEFAVRTLCFAWHLTTIVWWGVAALFWRMAQGPLSSAAASRILAIVFPASAGVTFAVSQGRHLAWPEFLAVGAIAWHGSRA
jgi:hypothetical protein